VIGVKTRGAILRKAPGAYAVIELDLAEPLQGELMVKMVGPGCATRSPRRWIDSALLGLDRASVHDLAPEDVLVPVGFTGMKAAYSASRHQGRESDHVGAGRSRAGLPDDL
jgi:hypothetical protein